MSIQADGTTYKLEGVELHAGETYKVRRDQNWDYNWGDPNSGDKDGNAVVAEDGTYNIVFDSVNGTITLEK